jgi:hypothetical protein
MPEIDHVAEIERHPEDQPRVSAFAGLKYPSGSGRLPVFEDLREAVGLRGVMVRSVHKRANGHKFWCQAAEQVVA